MLWINFLHLYQPVNIDGNYIKEATELSYLRLVRALEKYPNIKFTFNISGCLIMRWQELGYTVLIKRIKKLVESRQIELTGSAAYHPLMPLISEKEAIRQIKENEKILFNAFGDNFLKLRGFFIPEMAYSPETAKIIKKLGYIWIMLDEIAYNGKLNCVEIDKVYNDKASGLKVIFRSRKFSSCYVPKKLSKIIENEKNDTVVITATDGELYGLRHKDFSAELEKILKNKKLKTKTISDFIFSHKDVEDHNILNCNWESTEEDLKQKQPYALWYNKRNSIQKKIWQLANLAYNTAEKYNKDDNYYWTRWHLVRGLASCTFWWASAKDFRHIYGPYAWSPDEIERGINELIRAIRAIEDISARNIKIKAEKLYIKIKKMVWKKHWTYYWKK